MELSQVLERLKFTIDKAKTLKPEHFFYGSYIDSFDNDNHCGTVCCIAGHYPNWGLIFLKYSISEDIPELVSSTSNRTDDVRIELEYYHGLSSDLIEHLFYGLNLFHPLFISNCQIYTRDLTLELNEVIQRFENVYSLLENRQLSPDFEVFFDE